MIEGALQRLEGATTDQETMAFWQTQPEAYDSRDDQS
jgi:hypothetical protein